MESADEPPGNATRQDDAVTAVPAPPSGLTARAEAMQNVKDAKEVTSGEVLGGDGPYGDLGGRTLSNLLKVHPFMSFFCWLAHRQYPASHRPETRVARHRETSTRLYWVCVSLDLIVQVVALTILIAAATAVLYKTIWLTGGSAPDLP